MNAEEAAGGPATRRKARACQGSRASPNPCPRLGLELWAPVRLMPHGHRQTRAQEREAQLWEQVTAPPQSW